MKRDDSLWKAILEDINPHPLKGGKPYKGYCTKQRCFNSPFRGWGFKVYTKEGAEQCLPAPVRTGVLVHVEVQGYNDADFAKRMFTYFYRIVDRYNTPVTCIAIFTGSNKSFMPSVYNYSFLGTEYTFKYNTYNIIDQDENLLRNSNNPFATVVLTALLALRKGKTSEKKLLELKTDLLKNLLQKSIHKSKIRAILFFLRNYISFDSVEIASKFDKEIILLTHNTATMGIEEFLLQRVKREEFERGVEKRNFEFAKVLLLETDFDLEKISGMVGLPVSVVQKIKASLK